MIEITRARAEDFDSISKELLKRGIEISNLENTMAIYDGKNLLGAAKYKREEITAFLEYMVVFEGGPFLDKLKDGLIKSLLNMADIEGVKIFLIQKDADEDFYKKIRFKELSDRDFVLSMDVDYSRYIYTKLPEFFEHACHSAKK